MKVLFVSRYNSVIGISPIILNQGESLKEKIELHYYPIKGNGIKAYISAIFKLRKYLKSNVFDIVHAHYSLTAFVTSLSGAQPLIVSLMGSDVKSKGIYRFFIRIFRFFYWKSIIVKSKDMKDTLQLNNVNVIPNGVNFSKFRPMEKMAAMKKIGWDASKKHLLFASNPDRPEKNFQLVKKAHELLKDNEVKLHWLVNVPNESIPYYLNASDVVLLSSLWEGSPNVIKEAMACNVPIVATDVGDVKKNIGTTEGCYISTFDANDFSDKIKSALIFNRRTNGRENIAHLNDTEIANKLIDLYAKTIG